VAHRGGLVRGAAALDRVARCANSLGVTQSAARSGPGRSWASMATPPSFREWPASLSCKWPKRAMA